MRFHEKSQITLSEDTTNAPKKVRFSEEWEDTDTALLLESLTRQETFAIGSHPIALGSIAKGKFLFIKPAADLEASFDGGAPMKFRGGKVSKLWVEFTTLSITISTAAQVVVLGIAGE